MVKHRATLSLPEALLWRELKGRHAPVRFRKQHKVGVYLLDFYCPAAKLAIEVDGKAHDMGNRPQHDERRDRIVREVGIDTLRIPATEVLADPVAVADSIVALCRDRLSPSVSR